VGHAMTDELDLVQKYVEAITWRKTTYIRPHEYFMRHDQSEVYDLLKRAIDEHGYDAFFYQTIFRYLDLGDFKYWAYDTLVNRERLDLDHPTKALSEGYTL
jgi:hypothetical protein